MLCNLPGHTIDKGIVPGTVCKPITYTKPMDLESFWSLETIGIHDNPHVTEALAHFNRTISFRNGRYEVSWPWKDDDFILPENYELALARLKSLCR